MRREWGWRKWGRRKWEETSCPAAGTASLAGVGHMELPPPVFQTQAKGPTVLTSSLEGEGGAAELGGEQPEETGQQEEGGREQQLGRKLQRAGGVWGEALPLPPSQLVSSPSKIEAQTPTTRGPRDQPSPSYHCFSTRKEKV